MIINKHPLWYNMYNGLMKGNDPTISDKKHQSNQCYIVRQHKESFDKTECKSLLYLAVQFI